MLQIVKHTDKWLHALASAFILLALFLILIGAGVAPVWSVVISIVGTAIVGLGKEYLLDVLIEGETAEVGDLIADAVGIAVAIIPVILYFVL